MLDGRPVAADGVLDGVLGLPVAGVLEQVVARDVADRVDPVGGGAEAVVRLDEPVLVGFDARGLDVPGVGVRPAAGRQQEAVALDRPLLAVVVLGSDPLPVVGLGGLGRAVAQVEVVPVAVESVRWSATSASSSSRSRSSWPTTTTSVPIRAKK